MKKVFVLIIVAAILSAALAGCAKPIENPVYTSAPNGDKIIDENTAKRAAAERADIPEKDIEFTKVVLDSDDGRYEYDIEFVHEGYEYELEVNALDGRITSFERERANRRDIPAVNNEENVSANISAPETSIPEVKYITRDEALAAALNKAELENVAMDALTALKIEFEIDDGVPEYEIEFKQGNYEYSYEINAVNGEIIHWEKDIDD